jgi:hypothetical protein
MVPYNELRKGEIRLGYFEVIQHDLMEEDITLGERIYIIYGGMSQMESVVFGLLIIPGALIFYEISALKKRVKSQEERINQLAKLTGYDNLSSYWVSDEVKDLATHLKRTGKEVEAVKRIREHTQMSLLEAKKYVDALD